MDSAKSSKSSKSSMRFSSGKSFAEAFNGLAFELHLF
jgi:hypothetical protein